MNRVVLFLRLSFLPVVLLCALSQRALAADGFDNNYVGGDANQLAVTINGVNRAALFGPGAMSVGSFFIGIPNGTIHDQDMVSSFIITGATSYLRSAYFDRVTSTTLYYRVYPAAGVPPAWSNLALLSQSVLPAGTCYTATQSNTWQQTNQSINVVQGLGNGNYVLEFYLQSELYDVGIENGNCTVNALELCNTSEIHNGRYISTRFNTTDPAPCDLPTIIASQSNPSKIAFQLINSPLPLELTYFHGKLRDKNVQLEWGTAQEQALQDFLIERSNNGFSWSALAKVGAAGNSTVPKNYAFSDQQPLYGINYYRLKARSMDGQLDISPTIAIDAGATPALIVWPNPVRETLHYQLPENPDEHLKIRVVNTNGQVISETANDGQALATIAIDQLAEGVYFLELDDQSGHHLAISRFVKMR